MKTTMVIGILLIVIGIVSLAYQGITYTTREKVVDLGPIEATREKTNRIPLPPLLGGLALVCGAVMLVSGSRR
jgi:uncharacterized membrane protein